MMEQCERKTDGADRLAVSLYYGLNTAIHKELIEYLEQNGDEGVKLLKRYNLHMIGPAAAREFRKIGMAYLFFQKEMPNTWDNQNERNDYLSLRRQQYLEMKKTSPVVFRFFAEKFGNAFTDKID